MKSRSMTLFGLPTILTVFIVITVLSFATLSLLSASGDRNALRRTNALIGSSYEIETMSELKIAEFTQELNELSKKSTKIDEALAKFLKVHPEITYNKTTRYLQFTLAQSILSMDVVLQVSDTTEKPLLTRISYRLTTQNGQDYSQDGDPVWGG
ncbi:MAG: hypothetical protein WBL80_09520 [Erysipelotrichaceae bacterium]